MNEKLQDTGIFIGVQTSFQSFLGYLKNLLPIQLNQLSGRRKICESVEDRSITFCTFLVHQHKESQNMGIGTEELGRKERFDR